MRHWPLAASLAGMSCVQPVNAQDEPSEQSEIVVTATRQAESILDVPIAIQALSGAELNESGIQTLTDLPAAAPGVFTRSNGGFTNLFIRGVGSSVITGADPSVALYVDDVPRIYATTSDRFVNVRRIEVLKGAQGGLYGRNATGGVVSVITHQPNTEGVDYFGLLTLGEDETFRLAGYANVPLSEKVAVMLSGERSLNDPYIKNNATSNPYTAAMFPNGSRFGTPQQTADRFNLGVRPTGLAEARFWQVDGKLLLQPSENFKVTFAGDYYDQADTTAEAQNQIVPAVTQAYLTGLLRNFGFDVQLPPGFQKTNGKFEASIGDYNLTKVREYGASATAVWNAPGIEITSISAYRDQKTDRTGSNNAGTVPDVSAYVVRDRHFFYQELRGVSTWDGPFHLLAGGTYLNSYQNGFTDISFFGGIASNPRTAAGSRVKNWSAYLQGSYDLTPNLTLTASGRYIREKNHTFFTLPSVSEFNSVQKKFLPSVTISYRLDQGNIYLRWARGFKAGGINPTVDPALFPNPRTDGGVFGPETVDTYELGYRQRLADGRLLLSTSLFYNDYQDLHSLARARAQFASTILLALINAGSARTYGFEQSVEWRAVDALTLGASVAYLNAKYKDFKVVNNPVLADLDLSGRSMDNAPKLQLAFTANLDQPVTEDLHLVGRALVSYTSRVRFALSPFPTVPDGIGPAYWLTNLRLGLQTADDRIGLSVFANNAFNKGYYVAGFSGAGGTLMHWGRPRVVGLELTVRP